MDQVCFNAVVQKRDVFQGVEIWLKCVLHLNGNPAGVVSRR